MIEGQEMGKREQRRYDGMKRKRRRARLGVTSQCLCRRLTLVSLLDVQCRDGEEGLGLEVIPK